MITQVQVSELAIPRSQVVRALMGIRHEWEDAAKGDSLVEVTASVGLLLFDVAKALGLQERELQLALGDLADDVTDRIAL